MHSNKASLHSVVDGIVSIDVDASVSSSLVVDPLTSNHS